MDEKIRDSLIEDSAVHGFLAKDKDRQLQAEEDPGFKLIPRSWEVFLLTALENPLLFGAFFTCSSRSNKLMKTEDEPARTVFCDHQNLSQGGIRGIVASSQGSRLQLQPQQFPNDTITGSLLISVKVSWTRNEDWNSH